MPQASRAILVVDDDASFADNLASSLQSLGYRCEIAADGEEARARIPELQPSLVLSEVLLPQLDGVRLCEWIKGHDDLSETSVVLMSSIYQDPRLANLLVARATGKGSGKSDGRAITPIPTVEADRDGQTILLPQALDEEPCSIDAYIAKPFGLAVLIDLASNYAGEPNASFEPRRALPGPALEEQQEEKVLLSPIQDIPPLGQQSDALVLSGSLEEHPLPELMHNYYCSGASGVLTFRHRGAKRRLFLLNGIVVAADSNATNETIGAMLLDEEQISAEQMARAIEELRRSSCRFGEALVRLGAITVTQRYDALRKQLIERSLKCFAMHQGSFDFSPDRAVAKDRTTFECHPIRLIFDGVRRYGEADALVANLSDYLEKYPVRTNRFPAYVAYLRGVSPEWDKMLQSFDGQSDLGSLSSRNEVPLDDLVKGVWALCILGVVAFQDGPDLRSAHTLGADTRVYVKPGATAELVPAAERLLRDYLNLRDADPWQLLGIAQDADPLTVRAAARSKMSEYHPDSLPVGLPGYVLERAKELHFMVARAVEAITGGSLSAQPMHNSGDQKVAASPALRAESARECVSAGCAALNASDPRRAVSAFESAARLIPDSELYPALASWARLQLTGPDLRTRLRGAERALRKATEAEPKSAVAQFYLGLLLKDTGRAAEAIAHFEAACRCDPGHKDARWHLQLAELQAEKTGPEQQAQRSFWERMLGSDS